jgi:hypothetical protein
MDNISDATKARIVELQGYVQELAYLLEDAADDAACPWDPTDDERDEADELADTIRDAAQDAQAVADAVGELFT